jgi:hypothetical protein
MRGNAARALAPALAVLALVGVVAVAATGSTSSGSGATRPPGDALLDTIVSLFMLLVVLSTALLVYGLMQRKAIAREMAFAKRYRRLSAVAFIVFMLVFTVVVYFRFRNWERNPIEEGITDPLRPRTPVTGEPSGADVPYEPRFAWLPVLVALALAAIGLAAVVVAARRPTTGARDDDSLAEALAEALDGTLDDLRAETDPRRAVIAAYARLERVLAAHGRPRAKAETPAEYLRRLLLDLEVGEQAVRRLTDLFTRAKFSQHEVDVGMKEEAIEALEDVRHELRDAEARETSERAGAVLVPEGRA